MDPIFQPHLLVFVALATATTYLAAYQPALIQATVKKIQNHNRLRSM
jgi:hypothetical protein